MCDFLCFSYYDGGVEGVALLLMRDSCFLLSLGPHSMEILQSVCGWMSTEMVAFLARETRHFLLAKPTDRQKESTTILEIVVVSERANE